MALTTSAWVRLRRVYPERVFGQQRPPWLGGVLAAALGVAAATAAVGALKGLAPTVSLSVVYFPVVLACAAVWGWSIGLLASFASAAAFNFFHLPPTGRFTIADSRNWIALIAFTIVALSASAIADLARTRAGEAERGRAEADLAAALARELLGGADTPTALAATSHRLASALGLSGVAIELAPAADAPDPARRRALPLRDGEGAPVARLLVPADIDADIEERLRRRVLPTLAALLAVALRRDAIQAEAVETRALRRSDDVKTALLRAVSHDLRTPLTAIVAAGHALGSASLTEEDRSELAEAVREEGERLSALVEKLLDLSRLQAGRAVPRQDWLSVAEVIEAARDGLPPGLARAVRMSLDPVIPDIRGDAAQLERALANLLENAARYSPTVTVTARASGDRVLISVVDQGPGISAADRERIFEPFYRVSPDGRGSGLGLAIARGFIEAGGGTIRVDSHPGQGATFVISLPAGSAQPPAPALEART